MYDGLPIHLGQHNTYHVLLTLWRFEVIDGLQLGIVQGFSMELIALVAVEGNVPIMSSHINLPLLDERLHI